MRYFILFIVFAAHPVMFMTGCGTVQKDIKARNDSFRYARYADATIEINESDNRASVQKAGIEASQPVSVSLPSKKKMDCEADNGDEEKFKDLCGNESAKGGQIEEHLEEICAMLRRKFDRRKDECKGQPLDGAEVIFSRPSKTGASYNFAGATVGTVIIGSAGAYGQNEKDGYSKAKQSTSLPESITTETIGKVTDFFIPFVEWGAILGITDQVGGVVSDGFKTAGDRYTDSNNSDLSDHSVTTTITEGVE